jgi:phosphomannomutase
VEFRPEDRSGIQEKVNNPALVRIGEFAVVDSDNIDGRRLHFEDGWIAARFSGTEPLLRIYAEADSPDKVTKMLDAAAEYLGV